MQNVHSLAAFDHSAGFVDLFQFDSAQLALDPTKAVGRQLASDTATEEEGRLLRATFVECLYSGRARIDFER